MAKPTDKDRLKKIKTGRWERQWSMTKAGITASSQAATQMLGSAFLPKDAREQRNKKILSEQSQYLVEKLGQLKGSVVKVGQIMALYGEHILPEEVYVALRTLEEQTTAVAWPAMEAAIKAELGTRYDHFSIEQDPIGCASLAQVHRAVHKKSGASVCLKIQYPGVAQSIDSDLGAIVTMLKYSRMINMGARFDEWVSEVHQLLLYEVDYLREARLTQEFAQLLTGNKTFVVPKIYPEYTTSRLLVSSFEEGVAVNDVSIAEIPKATRNRLAREFLQLFINEVFEWGKIQTDPNFGNYRIQKQEDGKYKIVLLDFGAVLQYPASFLNPLKAIVLGSCRNDYAVIKQGAIDLGMMQPEYPEEVHVDFARLCQLLVEPFTYQHAGAPEDAINSKGEYCWGNSRLPKRAGKHAANSAMSRYFAVPPKEFAFMSRKLLGVYSFISALDAEFDPQSMLDKYSLN